MKRTFLLLLIVFAGIVNINAQESKGSCYNDYYTTFRDRGSKDVPDGNTEVVISIRKAGECICLLGKITVKNGKPVNDLMLAKDDGSFERFKFIPSPKYSHDEITIHNFIANGMSPSYLSSNDEVINLFFIKYLNEKPVRYKTAPPIK